jgi:Sulfotransferase family
MRPEESIAKCWTGSRKPHEQRAKSVQNCLYSQHYNVSSNLSGKTGTSTQKEVLGKVMGAVEVPCHSIPPHEHLLKVATIREPFDRFVSGYKEAMSRQGIYGTRNNMDEVEIPPQYTRFLEVLENKSIAEKKEIFDAQTPSLLQLKTQMFEAFVHDYDGKNVFDRHLNAQVIKLWDPLDTTGMGQFDVILESSTLTDDLAALANRVGAPPMVQEVRARSRTNDRLDIASLQDSTIQKICRLFALDYCCLNYKLPEACSRALSGERVMCDWVTGDNNSADSQIRSILV